MLMLHRWHGGTFQLQSSEKNNTHQVRMSFPEEILLSQICLHSLSSYCCSIISYRFSMSPGSCPVCGPLTGNRNPTSTDWDNDISSLATPGRVSSNWVGSFSNHCFETKCYQLSLSWGNTQVCVSTSETAASIKRSCLWTHLEIPERPWCCCRLT